VSKAPSLPIIHGRPRSWSGIKPYTDDLARTMFVHTADENYILARIAFHFHLDWNFFWLSAHSLEKYFKATLLMDDRAASKFSHNLVRLHDAVLQLCPAPMYAPFVEPAIDGLHWRKCSVREYLTRLDEMGSPDNRYGIYGYSTDLDDLCKVDQLVWAVRRHCRRFKRELPGSDHVPDEVDILRRKPQRWAINDLLPIERLVAKPKEDLRRRLFLHLNTPFNPNKEHVSEGWRFSAFNSPLSSWLERLGATRAEPHVRQTAAQVLEWALENIKFSLEDKKFIKGELQRFGAGQPWGPPSLWVTTLQVYCPEAGGWHTAKWQGRNGSSQCRSATSCNRHTGR
jgi:hypothetical protein